MKTQTKKRKNNETPTLDDGELGFQDLSFRGNTNIKGRGVPVEWTEERVAEWLKCANDPIYFAERYINIVHVDHGLIPIDLYEYQAEIIKKVKDNRRVIVTTARQAGKTTTAVAIILHYVLFNEHKTVALLANKGDSAREILERVQIAYEALPKWIQQGVISWNKGSVILENGCKILAGSTSSSSIRGKSISFLYIDEAAFVENWDEFFASVFPTITSGMSTKILMTSTPNGLNHFYKIWDGAIKDKNGYKHVQVHWTGVPGRGEEWKKETLEGMNHDLQKFRQEFECEFLGSSGTLIDGATLAILDYKIPLTDGAGLKMYEKPDKDRIYVIVADTSHGKGLDYSAFHVVDITKMPYKQVCTFRDNMTTPMDYAEVIHRVSLHYNNAYILAETNDLGTQVADTLHMDYEAENILYTESAGRNGKRISSGFGKNVEKGIRTTRTVKSTGCSILKLLIEQRQLEIVDFDTISELSTFSKKGVSYEAEPGHHDDLVMGLVLFAWLSDQIFFKDMTDINTLAMLRDKSEEQMMEELTPFGFYDDGIDAHEEVVIERPGSEWSLW